MVDDLPSRGRSPAAEVTIYRGNSKELASVLPKGAEGVGSDHVAAYPNRFSYARETRPHLFFFDFIESATAVGQLETDAIGGTWGKATSVLARGIRAKNDVDRELARPASARHPLERQPDGELRRQVFQRHLRPRRSGCQGVQEAGCRLAYVIGNSKFYDHPLPSDEILASIFGHFGFELERIDRMRKRQSKTGLYEAVVFMCAQLIMLPIQPLPQALDLHPQYESKVLLVVHLHRLLRACNLGDFPFYRKRVVPNRAVWQCCRTPRPTVLSQNLSSGQVEVLGHSHWSAQNKRKQKVFGWPSGKRLVWVFEDLTQSQTTKPSRPAKAAHRERLG